MDDLVVFLKARLDEDEAVARAAIEKSAAPPEWRKGVPTGHWRPVAADYGDGPVWEHMPWEVYDGDLTVVSHQAYEGGGISDKEIAAHISRHDPARVLREVAAKRAILAGAGSENGRAHEPLSMNKGPGTPASWPDAMCDGCNETWPCETVRLFAAIYSTHPGYQDGWKP